MEKQTSTKIWTHWFEIPVKDMSRAKKFYDTLFSISIEIVDFGGFTMGIFPHGQVGCALCLHESYIPSQAGVLVYMDASPDLKDIQDKIENAGGKVLRPKAQISSEHGYMALFLDTEGNRIALHSIR